MRRRGKEGSLWCSLRDRVQRGVGEDGGLDGTTEGSMGGRSEPHVGGESVTFIV